MWGSVNTGKAFCVLAAVSFLVLVCGQKPESEEGAAASMGRIKAPVGIPLLESRIKSVRTLPQILAWGTERHLLLRQDAGGGFWSSMIWEVKEGKPRLLLKLPNYCLPDNSGLAVIKTFISNSAGGRIWQRYYLYWDKEEQRYQEYAAREITEEEFLSLKNAEEVKEQVESAIREEAGEDLITEIQAENYIKRDNGIININYRILCGEGASYRYAILTVREGEICTDILPADSHRLYEWGYISESGEFDLEVSYGTEIRRNLSYDH